MEISNLLFWELVHAGFKRGLLSIQN